MMIMNRNSAITGERCETRQGRVIMLENRLLRLLGTFLVFASLPLHAVELDCLVKPEMYVELSSPVDSVLESFLVETGDSVTRGQPLVKLEASVEKAKVKLAELHANSVNDIQNSKVQLKYAKRNNRRTKDLFAKNSISQFEKDKAETEVELAQIELNKAIEQKRIAQLNLELAQTQLELKTIKSPIDGIVVDRYTMAGESVGDRSIMKLAKINPLTVELIASAEYFGLIVEGMEVDIHPEQPANQSFKATVSLVDQLIDPASGTFTVRMELPNPDERLVSGVSCLASFGFEAPEPSRQGSFGSLAVWPSRG